MRLIIDIVLINTYTNYLSQSSHQLSLYIYIYIHSKTVRFSSPSFSQPLPSLSVVPIPVYHTSSYHGVIYLQDLWGRPLFLFPIGLHSVILFTLLLILALLCPYHFNLLSPIYVNISFSSDVFCNVSTFLFLSILVTLQHLTAVSFVYYSVSLPRTT